jgi:hypothetical protein
VIISNADDLKAELITIDENLLWASLSPDIRRVKQPRSVITWVKAR